ncbi:hypothetical protein MHU86_5236 [Fragilaria crotonensis]|nr:hypothetical protein MHU86_5236 [Fragilaria crotonensis]
MLQPRVILPPLSVELSALITALTQDQNTGGSTCEVTIRGGGSKRGQFSCNREGRTRADEDNFSVNHLSPRIETIHKSHLNVLDTPPPAGYPSCSITSSNVNSTADPADPKIHQKAVKRGFKSSRLPQVCGVSFERLPAWLWTLRPSEWSTILISESDKRRIDQFHPALNKHYHNKFRVISMPLGSNPLVLEAVMWWTSGSEPFANSLMLPIGLPLVEWVTGMSRRAAPDTSTSRQWLNVSHAKVGGSTTSRAKFRVSGVSERIDIPQDLTRSIGHILKYSIRAKPCSPDLSIPHYVGSSKLAIHQLSKVVLVPSHFSATGWGYRPLDPTELAAAFELPDYLAWDEDFSTNLVPLQILRGVMDSVLETQTPPVQPRGGQRPCQRSDVIPDITVLDQNGSHPSAMVIRYLGKRSYLQQSREI